MPNDLFLAAFTSELEATQRAIASNCLLCIPQARSLAVDQIVTPENVYTHFLTPMATEVGVYATLNGKEVVIKGSYIYTHKGFLEHRKVRILLSEQRELACQRVTILHLSRPLEGGIVVPEDPNEIDVLTFRRYTAMLRSFPENELVFHQLDATIAHVHKICRAHQFFDRYERTLPSLLRNEWTAAVDAMRHSSLDGLQMQQVVECYLMEALHDALFPRVLISCATEEEQLHEILYRMRHHTPHDFGIRPEFQCFLASAREELLLVKDRKTPLDMLIAFKNCIDRIHDAVQTHLKQHHLDFGMYQMTTDDILDQLLFVMVQAFTSTLEASTSSRPPAAAFPIASILQYISDYHFINSNTTALGFTMANFQVAVEYFLLRATQVPSVSVVEAAHNRNLNEMAKQIAQLDANDMGGQAKVHEDNDDTSWRQLFIIGDWSNDDTDAVHETEEMEESFVHAVDVTELHGARVLQISGGHRFFACVDESGRVFTWGDATGGRLGFVRPDGHQRRLMRPHSVWALDSTCITHIACGAFHTLATDINGHVFVWGNNAHGQLGFLTPPLFGSSTVVETPMQVTELRGVYMSAVACGAYHSLALSSRGHVYSWGCSKYQKLGRKAETFVDALQPQVIPASWIGRTLEFKPRSSASDGIVRRIAAGKDHSIAVTSDGAVFTWGRGTEGQLGHGCNMDVSEPMQMRALADAQAFVAMEVAAGACFSMILMRNGMVFVCGNAHDVTPRLVMLSKRVVAIASGEAFAILLLENGHLVRYEPSSDPEQDGLIQQLEMPFNNIKKLACGASHTLVLA